MIEKVLANNPTHYFITENKQDQTILFVHAAFADHTQYDKQAEYFSRDYRAITIDLIGHGKSISTKKGVSIGAVLIQDFANHYPEMVSFLSCFGGYDINNFDTSMQRENSKAQMTMMLKALFSIKWFAKSYKRVSAYTLDAQELFYQMNIRFKKKSFMYLSGLGN